jgi:hypothetical protein
MTDWQNPNTLKEWLEFDIDAYLVQGGNLGNVLVGFKTPTETELAAIARTMTLEQFQRFVRFTDFLGRVVVHVRSVSGAGSPVIISDYLSEAELRSIWHSTAGDLPAVAREH